MRETSCMNARCAHMVNSSAVAYELAEHLLSHEEIWDGDQIIVPLEALIRTREVPNA